MDSYQVIRGNVKQAWADVHPLADVPVMSMIMSPLIWFPFADEQTFDAVIDLAMQKLAEKGYTAPPGAAESLSFQHKYFGAPGPCFTYRGGLDDERYEFQSCASSRAILSPSKTTYASNVTDAILEEVISIVITGLFPALSPVSGLLADAVVFAVHALVAVLDKSLAKATAAAEPGSSADDFRANQIQALAQQVSLAA